MADRNDWETEGKIDRLRGKIQEGVGKLTGDRSAETEGKTKSALGSIKEGLGKAGNDLKDR